MFKRITSPNHPLGWWRCTFAKEGLFASNFKVGAFYQCRPDTVGGPRIFPYPGSAWAPYWVEAEGRFCYSSSELRFEYVGPEKSSENADLKKQVQYHLDAIQSLLKGIK